MTDLWWDIRRAFGHGLSLYEDRQAFEITAVASSRITTITSNTSGWAIMIDSWCLGCCDYATVHGRSGLVTVSGFHEHHRRMAINNDVEDFSYTFDVSKLTYSNLLILFVSLPLIKVDKKNDQELKTLSSQSEPKAIDWGSHNDRATL